MQNDLTQDEKVRMSVANGEEVSLETMRNNLEQDIIRLRVFVHDILSNPGTIDLLARHYHERYQEYRNEIIKQNANVQQ